MKLIIAGSTGLVGAEIIRQALSIPEITSVVGLARRETPTPANLGPNADVSKLKSVVVIDFENYPEDVKQELAGADACIWTIATTPEKLGSMTTEESKKISHDYLIYGLETMAKTANTPFRFAYISGAKSERDQTKKPFILGEFCLMRGECENRVIDFAKRSDGRVVCGVARPGIIAAPGRSDFMLTFVGSFARALIGLPKVDVTEVAAALLESCISGFEKETLLNEDLGRIGQKAMAERTTGPA
ncbi:hypothetical protein S7711_03588 [Stachybotrys chartarum IBT 7711]|uniref:NAD(P)-binding domain-containing protein n=1 Tax=Stachybotrys chartarum (strain CBS 109288 / IBT 7711) TaxID=1280523 RepID=A0A084AGU2_STACB|nr:hypothetical protein S7711_03588 [Stachybotrys chartarum IBT 7711]KFA50988.1 hypothetical protein S40293_07267 [Stachybotrys chartarum IBT 40293]